MIKVTKCTVASQQHGPRLDSWLSQGLSVCEWLYICKCQSCDKLVCCPGSIPVFAQCQLM